MRLGFIGTGAITAAMVRGLKGSALADWPVLLSPRNADLAAELARLPGVTVAVSNQAVIDGADLVILAVRPQVAEAVLRPLAWPGDRKILSLVAGLRAETYAGWTGRTGLVRAIPLPFVATRQGVTPVFPPDPAILTLFAALGTALPVTDLATYDAYGAASALMASYFGLVQTAQDWLVGKGLPPPDADAYLRGLFGSLGDVLRQSPLSPDALREDHSTKGGLNEQVFHRFVELGGRRALETGLDDVLKRIRS